MKLYAYKQGTKKTLTDNFIINNMTIKKLWILTTIFIIGFIVIFCVLYMEKSLNLGMKQTSFIFRHLFLNLIIFLISGILIGLLVALIPFRQQLYKEKLKKTILFAISIILFLYFVNISYWVYETKEKGIELMPVINYDDIKKPVNLDCSSVHNGKFEDDNTIIERKGNQQFQINKKSGVKSEYNISWISDCEYVLTPIPIGSDILRIKIISVNSSSYGCYVNNKMKRKDAFYVYEKHIK